MTKTALKSVFDCFLAGYRANPGRVYISVQGTDQLTYDQCYLLIIKLATVVSASFGEGKYFILSSDDPLVFVLSFWACIMCGADVLLLSGVTRLDDEFIKNGIFMDFATHIRSAQGGSGYNVFDTADSYQGASKVYFLTSGTTGSSKVIVNLADQIITALSHIGSYCEMKYLHAVSTCFISMPLNHSYGLSCILEYTCCGSTIILPKDKFILTSIGCLCNKELAGHIESVEGVPFFYEQLARFSSKLKLQHLKHLGFGGDHVDRSLLEIYHDLIKGVNFTVRYGLTEIPSVVAVQSFYEISEYEPRVIKNWLSPYCLFLKDKVLDKGSVSGELCIGFDDQKVAGICTGDLVEVVNDKFVITGRTAAIFKYKGVKVNPLNIEDVICRFDFVTVGRVYLDEKSILCADLVINQGFERLEFMNFLKAELPDYLIPTKMVVVNELNRTSTGKIKRT